MIGEYTYTGDVMKRISEAPRCLRIEMGLRTFYRDTF